MHTDLKAKLIEKTPGQSFRRAAEKNDSQKNISKCSFYQRKLIPANEENSAVVCVKNAKTMKTAPMLTSSQMIRKRDGFRLEMSVTDDVGGILTSMTLSSELLWHDTKPIKESLDLSTRAIDTISSVRARPYAFEFFMGIFSGGRTLRSGAVSKRRTRGMCSSLCGAWRTV